MRDWAVKRDLLAAETVERLAWDESHWLAFSVIAALSHSERG
jgi:hypothetical protein